MGERKKESEHEGERARVRKGRESKMSSFSRRTWRSVGTGQD